jgi:mono/diheme cytochrome c family protein
MGSPRPCCLAGFVAGVVLFETIASAIEPVNHAGESPSPRPHPLVVSFERFGRDSTSPSPRLSEPDAGRLLIGELGCTACHAGPASLAAKMGPDLSGVGDRVRADWMRRFLADPSTVSPGTTMPHMLASLDRRERSQAAAALAAHLASLQKPVPLPKPGGLNPMPPAFHDLGDASRGRRLYHRIGCVACHEALDPSAAPETPSPLAGLDPEDLLEAGIPPPEPRFPSAPLTGLAAKYSRKSLTEFLLVPLHARPSGRMPDLRLKAAEAADIAAALLSAALVVADGEPSLPSQAGGSEEADSPGLADRGRDLFARLHCGSCHTGAADPPAPKPPASADPGPALAAVDPDAEGACIATVPTGRGPRAAPWYPLDDSQRRAILAALDGLRVAPRPDGQASAPAGPGGHMSSELDMALMRLGCLACHERNGRGGVGTDRRPYFETVDRVDLGDEGRLPPRLTGVGARLRSDWLAKALAGSVALRPFMHARMPHFPKQSLAGLAGAFVAADRPETASVRRQVVPEGGAGQPPRALVEAGAKLLDLGCIQCHPLGSHVLPGTVGVSLEGVTRRVEPDWFRRLLLDPMAVRPGTKMPAFFGDTVNRSILDGNAESQIAAIWAYLDRDRLEPLPSRLASAAGDFELAPRDEPIVFRTFMQRAGTHAIAVGFPQGVHLAFDAEDCRLAEAWRGRFLDARGTWVLAKTSPPADPLGTDRVVIDRTAPVGYLEGPPAAVPWPGSAGRAEFLGYSLDAGGVPTFRYRLGGTTIRERFVPEGHGESKEAGSPKAGGGSGSSPSKGLVRQISLSGPSPQTSEPTRGTGGPAEPAGGAVWLCALSGKTVESHGSSARRLGESPPLEATVRIVSKGGDPTTPPSRLIEREGVAEETQAAWIVRLPADGSTMEVHYRW